MTDREQERTGPVVTAVVLTWNDTEMVSRSVESLYACDPAPDRILVVDNGSTEPVAPTLERRFPQVQVLRLEDNQGFAGGCNRGLERAMADGADYLFLLNNDTIIKPWSVGRLTAALAENDDVGMASAILIDESDPPLVRVFRGEVNRNLGTHRHPDKKAPYTDAYHHTITTGFAAACAIMLRRRALEEVGLFDEQLYICWEDYDLCLRFADQGWRILCVGGAPVIHAHGQTTGKASPYITYYYTRNRLICLFRHGRLLPILGGSLHIARTFWWQVKKFGLRNGPCLKAFLLGWLHALAVVRGKGSPPQSRKG